MYSLVAACKQVSVKLSLRKMKREKCAESILDAWIEEIIPFLPETKDHQNNFFSNCQAKGMISGQFLLKKY